MAPPPPPPPPSPFDFDNRSSPGVFFFFLAFHLWSCGSRLHSSCHAVGEAVNLAIQNLNHTHMWVWLIAPPLLENPGSCPVAPCLCMWNTMQQLKRAFKNWGAWTPSMHTMHPCGYLNSYHHKEMCINFYPNRKCTGHAKVFREVRVYSL